MDDNRFHATANLEDIIDDSSALDKLFEQATEESERRLWDDPEWSAPRWTHRKDTVRAFLVGVVNADPWFAGYSLPPNIEVVANALCGAIAAKFEGDNESVMASLLDLEALYREFIDAAPLCKEWNEYPGSGFVSRYSAAPTERTFIDLDALVRNAAIHVRDDRRDFDRFNAEFEARYAKEQPST